MAAGVPLGMWFVRHVAFAREPLVIDGQTWAQKDVQPGASLSRRFTITNRSASPVRIESIERSCRCTTATLAPNPILPGESSVLDCTLHVPPGGDGAKATIVLKTDNSHQPTVSVHMEAQTRDTLTIEPLSLYWRQETASGPFVRRVILRRLDERGLSTPKVHLPAGMTCEIRRLSDEACEAVLTVAEWPEREDAVVEFLTDVRGFERVSLPVCFEGLPPVVILPETILIFGPDGRGSVCLYGQNGLAVTSAEVIRRPEFLAVTFARDDGAMKVEASMSANTGTLSNSDHIVIRATTDQGSHDLTIPVRVYLD
ncbi:MAG: DUF1573 domain-containing protein [Phycisphaerae bacterium]|nr:DUF1573 domain-containing protein [Phycisphaerae bacterium]